MKGMTFFVNILLSIFGYRPGNINSTTPQALISMLLVSSGTDQAGQNYGGMFILPFINLHTSSPTSDTVSPRHLDSPRDTTPCVLEKITRACELPKAILNLTEVNGSSSRIEGMSCNDRRDDHLGRLQNDVNKNSSFMQVIQGIVMITTCELESPSENSSVSSTSTTWTQSIQEIPLPSEATDFQGILTSILASFGNKNNPSTLSWNWIWDGKFQDGILKDPNFLTSRFHGHYNHSSYKTHHFSSSWNWIWDDDGKLQDGILKDSNFLMSRFHGHYNHSSYKTHHFSSSWKWISDGKFQDGISKDPEFLTSRFYCHCNHSYYTTHHSSSWNWIRDGKFQDGILKDPNFLTSRFHGHCNHSYFYRMENVSGYVHKWLSFHKDSKIDASAKNPLKTVVVVMMMMRMNSLLTPVANQTGWNFSPNRCSGRSLCNTEEKTPITIWQSFRELSPWAVWLATVIYFMTFMFEFHLLYSPKKEEDEGEGRHTYDYVTSAFDFDKIKAVLILWVYNVIPMKVNWMWLFALSTVMLISTGDALVHIQNDDVARSDSGLTWRKTFPPLTSFTFCVRLFSYRSRYSDYFFSYATNHSDNEMAFHLKYDSQELRFACCRRRIFHIVDVQVSPLKWFSFCAAVDLVSTTATFVHPGGVDSRGMADSEKDFAIPLKIDSGGIVIIGQDQDEPGGGTDREQSFNGYMSDLYMTANLLTQEEMQNYIACKAISESHHPPLMDFRNLASDFMLGVSTSEVGDYGIRSCPANNKMYSVFPEARNFGEAKHFCSTLNGEVALPLNEEDNVALFNEGSKSADKCSAFEKSSGVWVGIQWDPDLGRWHNISSKDKVSFTNFQVEVIPVYGIVCAISKALTESLDIARDGNWDVEQCERSICTACQFEEPKPLRIRGLCAESIFDRQYYIYGIINDRPVFNGMSWSKIAWNNSESAYDYTWTLYQIAEPLSVYARMMRKSEVEYPIGVHEFEVIGDKCPRKQIRLKLTSCPDGMYTCSDGSCIHISKRCNLELDCIDRGDELNCDTVVLPPGYDKRLPPPKLDSETPAEVAIDFNFRLIRKFSLLDSHITVDVVITRSWYDSRVRYKNLHDSKNLNLIEEIVDVIWYPDVTLLGADSSIANYDILSTTGWGQRLTAPEEDDDQLIDEDLFYSGSGNVLMLEREMTVTLMCTFVMTMYPFDSQKCTLIFYVGDYTQHYVSTVLNKVEFSGTRRLLEYEVTSVEHESLLYQNKSGQQITIVLTNLYGYYISGAYIPTLLLIIVSYSTFYFSLEDFTNRVMVSLTSLLVLASLFNQIASGLPKTAYMKLIDVWFIFCILADFVMVILLVFINSVVTMKASDAKVTFIASNGFSSKIPVAKGLFERLDAKLCNRIALVMLPTITGIFITVYFGVVVNSLNHVKYTF